jgi:hypothetical protein
MRFSTHVATSMFILMTGCGARSAIPEKDAGVIQEECPASPHSCTDEKDAGGHTCPVRWPSLDEQCHLIAIDSKLTDAGRGGYAYRCDPLTNEYPCEQPAPTCLPMYPYVGDGPQLDWCCCDCVPTTCGDVAVGCGTFSDGCGGTITCACAEGSTCNEADSTTETGGQCCAGCVADDGSCMPGFGYDYCGVGGAACVQCDDDAGPTTCSDGQCVPCTSPQDCGE